VEHLGQIAFESMSKAQIHHLTITQEINLMAKRDQEMRNNYDYDSDEGEWDDSVDLNNTQRMKEIVGEIGWPTISKVGMEASNNAWLLVQHADHDTSFQEKCLELMKSQPESEVSKSNIAFLEDRIAVAKGKPQIYGTQFTTNEEGQFEPHPLFDPDNVDQHRKQMGLDTLANNLKRMEEFYGS
jgi:hypothetical protein